MSIKLKGSSDGSVSFDAPADTSPSGSDITLVLPTTVGSAEQFLKNSGTAGTLEFSSMVETSTGVGIGTSSPSGLLHLAASSEPSLYFEDTGSSNTLSRVYKSGSSLTFNSRHTSAGQFVFNSENSGGTATERMRIDSSGSLLVNTSTSRSVMDQAGNGPTPKLQIEGEDSNAIISVISAGDADANRCGTVNLGRHRNGTVGGTPTIVQNGDALGAVVFSGGDGGDMLTCAAKIHAVVDGAPGANDMPGALLFSTTPDGQGHGFNTERMRIDSSGFITQKFTSNNSSTPEGLFINNENNGTGNNASLIFSNDSGNRKKVAIAAVDVGNYGASDLVFALDGADSGSVSLSSDEKMRIDSSGRVGIGTTSPDGKLHVHSGSAGSVTANGNANNLVVENSDTGGISILTPDNGFGYIMWGSPTSNEGAILRYRDSDNIFSIGTEDANGILQFRTGAGTERMRLDSSGYLALGTTSPSSYVGGGNNFVIASSGNAGMTIATGTSSSASINFADGTSGDALYRGRLEYSHSLDALDIITGGTTQARIDSSGRLLVGTTSPSNGASFGNIVLEFAGNSFNGIKTRDTDNTGTVTHMVFVSGSSAVGRITGTTGAVSYNNLSDYRKKENDVEIADGIEKVKLLRPIRFNYISDPSTVCDGFFAHEVTPAVPTAVTGAKDAVDSEGEIDPQMLDASKLVPLLTAALQEAIAKIETLETKVAALEAQ